MAFLEWSEDFSVSVKEIDSQHRMLVDRINDLHQAMLDNRGREAQQDAIRGMADYANVHFETEEKHMRRLNYPDYPKHRAEHERFAVKAYELQKRSGDGKFELTPEILDFLKDWLQNHILTVDKEYSRFFNENGVK